MKDLTGQKFGQLTVKSYAKTKKSNWNCECQCGNLCIVKQQNLIRGSTKSCGCLRKKMASKDLIDKTFGYLTVIEKYGYKIRQKTSSDKKNYKPDKNIVWKCLCHCGNTHFVTTAMLCGNQVKSCGCKKTKRIYDLTGKIFGELTVISFSNRTNHRTFWLCKCNCGNEKILDIHHIKNGQQKTCGCKKGGWKHGFCIGVDYNKKEYYKHLRKNPERILRTNVSGAVRSALKKNNSKKDGKTFKHLPYSVQDLKKHLESLFEPWMNWSNYGGKPNDKRKTWWLDHIIPQSKFKFKSLKDLEFQKCWALENLRPLEKKENMIKGDNLIY